GKPPEAGAVVWVSQGLDGRDRDIFAPVRGEGEQTEGIAERAHGLAENRDRQAFDLENGDAGGEAIAGRFGNVEQQQDREITTLCGRGAKYPRVGFPAHPQCDAGVEHGVDIEVMAVELSLQPDRSPDAHAADQPSYPVAQNVGALERLFHKTWIAGPRGNLAHRGPFRALNPMRAVPFGIFCDHEATLVRRDGPGAADLAFVSMLVGPERGLIRIIARLNA